MIGISNISKILSISKGYDDLLEIELKQLQSMLQSFVMNDREKGRVAQSITVSFPHYDYSLK